MNALRYGACFVGIAVMLITAVAVKADTPPTHGIGSAVTSINPDYAGTCDFEHRMDIEIIGGIWFECQCVALARGWDCAWVELGQPAVANFKRRIKHHTLHRRVMRFALPAVVA